MTNVETESSSLESEDGIMLSSGGWLTTGHVRRVRRVRGVRRCAWCALVCVVCAVCFQVDLLYNTLQLRLT